MANEVKGGHVDLLGGDNPAPTSPQIQISDDKRNPLQAVRENAASITKAKQTDVQVDYGLGRAKSSGLRGLSIGATGEWGKAHLGAGLSGNYHEVLVGAGYKASGLPEGVSAGVSFIGGYNWVKQEARTPIISAAVGYQGETQVAGTSIRYNLGAALSREWGAGSAVAAINARAEIGKPIDFAGGKVQPYISTYLDTRGNNSVTAGGEWHGQIGDHWKLRVTAGGRLDNNGFSPVTGLSAKYEF